MTRCRFCRCVTAVCLGAFFLIAGPASAALISIDFEADTEGAVLDGFVPAGVSGVSFSDSVGEDLYVTGVLPEGSGLHSLFVGTDQDLSQLQISLGFTADFISLDFGNDDPSFTKAGDLAVLTAYQGITLVGQSTMTLNVDDLMNQTITFGAVGGSDLFDSLTFAYTDEFFNFATGGGSVNVGAAEVVDNILINQISPPISPIPEPGTLVLLGAGLTGLTFLRRNRRQTENR